MKKKELNLPKQRTFTGPAPMWKRIGAFIIDILVIQLILALPFQSILRRIVPQKISYSEAYQLFTNNSALTSTLAIVMAVLSILAVFYFSVSEYKLGQSIGKIIMNIKVVSDRNSLNFWQCIGRSLFLLPIFPFFLLWFIDPIYLFFNKKGQRLSEVLTKTMVVQDYIG